MEGTKWKMVENSSVNWANKAPEMEAGRAKLMLKWGQPEPEGEAEDEEDEEQHTSIRKPFRHL